MILVSLTHTLKIFPTFLFFWSHFRAGSRLTCCCFVVCANFFEIQTWFPFSPFKKNFPVFQSTLLSLASFFFFQEQQHTSRCCFLLGLWFSFHKKEPSWEKKKFFVVFFSLTKEQALKRIQKRKTQNEDWEREKETREKQKIQKFFELPRIFKGPPKRTWQIYNRSALPGIQPYLQLIWFHGR
jgi:hypothetical protein